MSEAPRLPIHHLVDDEAVLRRAIVEVLTVMGPKKRARVLGRLDAIARQLAAEAAGLHNVYAIRTRRVMGSPHPEADVMLAAAQLIARVTEPMR